MKVSSLICVIAASLFPHVQTLSSLVDLGYAKYRGEVLENGINQYLGIPYATPPVGDMRWRASSDPETQSQTQDAMALKPVCIGEWSDPGASEDCLYVNVFAPSAASSSSRLPVWVFIQGGGYAGNTDPNYNGTQFITRSGFNIVFVQLNYRVGAYGFLASNNVKQDGDLNVGLLDQRKALEWVQEYIGEFGGDPDHVVIHGDSAGAGSVALHLSAYGGRNDNLFVGAIAQSPFMPTQRTVADLESQFDNFAAMAGCGATLDPLSCLRSKSTSELLSAQAPLAYLEGGQPPIVSFVPCTDGDFIRDYPTAVFDDGRFLKVPLMVGDDNNEGTGFVPDASSVSDVATFMQDQYPSLTSKMLLQMDDIYPLSSPLPKHNAYFPSLAAAYGEATLICPGLRLSSSMAQHNSPTQVWNYRYNVYDELTFANGLGVPHVAELPAIFGTGPSGSGKGAGTSLDTYNANIVPVMMDYWINFVRFLNPNGPYLDDGTIVVSRTGPEWKPFGQGFGNQRLRIETNSTRMEWVPMTQRVRCAFWKEVTSFTRN